MISAQFDLTSDQILSLSPLVSLEFQATHNNPLPAWFKLDNQVALSNLDSRQILALIKARNERRLEVQFKPAEAFWPELCKLQSGLAEVSSDADVAEICQHVCRQLLHLLKCRADQELLNQPNQLVRPLSVLPNEDRRAILLMEPGTRTGVKMASFSNQGELGVNSIVFPHEPQNQWQQSLRKLANLITAERVDAIVVVVHEGYRECRHLVKAYLAEQQQNIPVYRYQPTLTVASDDQDSSDDPLYQQVNLYGRQLLNPKQTFATMSLKHLTRDPLLSCVNQWQLQAVLDSVWQAQNCYQTLEPDPLFTNSVKDLSDLTRGQTLVGQVVKLTQFGCFIDVGIVENGLLHQSQIPTKTNLHFGDYIKVEVADIHMGKQQFSLKWPGGGKTTKPKSRPKPERAPANSAMADALSAAFKKRD